jgi:hypothetical protein
MNTIDVFEEYYLKVDKYTDKNSYQVCQTVEDIRDYCLICAGILKNDPNMDDMYVGKFKKYPDKGVQQDIEIYLIPSTKDTIIHWVYDHNRAYNYNELITVRGVELHVSIKDIDNEANFAHIFSQCIGK